MLFYNIAIKTAIAISGIAIVSNIALCFVNGNYNLVEQLKSIIIHLRPIGTLYFAFAWFMGNGSRVASGRTTYEDVAYWLLVVSVGWLIVFAVTLLSKIFNREEIFNSGSLKYGVLYFVLAFLLH